MVGLVLLLLLDEEVEHLCLDELLDKGSAALGLHSLQEALFLERSALLLTAASPPNVIRKVTHRFHEECQEGLRDHLVQFLCG